MSQFEDLFSLAAPLPKLSSERSQEEQQYYKAMVSAIECHARNTLLISICGPQQMEMLSCYQIVPTICCPGCHSYPEERMTQEVLRDGRSILCCCQASEWLAERDLIRSLEIHFPLFS